MLEMEIKNITFTKKNGKEKSLGTKNISAEFLMSFPAYSGYLHSLACSPFLKLLESLTSVIISSTSGWLSCLHFNMDPCDHIEYNATHISKIFFAK